MYKVSGERLCIPKAHYSGYDLDCMFTCSYRRHVESSSLKIKATTVVDAANLSLSCCLSRGHPRAPTAARLLAAVVAGGGQAPPALAFFGSLLTLHGLLLVHVFLVRSPTLEVQGAEDEYPTLRERGE